MMNYDTGPANLVATRNPSRDHMIIDLRRSITEERIYKTMNYDTGPAILVTSPSQKNDIELRWTMALVQPT